MTFDDSTEKTISKHFTPVPDNTFLPKKINEPAPYTPENMEEIFNRYWQHLGQKYYASFRAGKLLGNSPDSNQNVLFDLGKIIEEGIRAGNIDAGLTSENLRDHFALLHTVLKVIQSDLNAIYARNNSEDAKTQSFDSNEILSLLSGYISSKVYGS